jgi:hypothetical protein
MSTELVTLQEIHALAETVATKLIGHVEGRLSARVAQMQMAAGEAQRVEAAAQAALAALEKRVQEAKARATAAEERAHAKEGEEIAIEQRIEARRIEEKRLDGVLVNLRMSITTAAASA